MARLWTRLSEVYGAARWEREYGPQPSTSWEHGLSGMTLEQIAAGIELAERDTTGRLPSLGLFRSWCASHKGPDDYAPLPKLSSLAAGSAAGREWLAYMRLEGIASMPAGMTREQVEEALDDADIGAMREAVAREVGHLHKLHGVKP